MIPAMLPVYRRTTNVAALLHANIKLANQMREHKVALSGIAALIVIVTSNPLYIVSIV